MSMIDPLISDFSLLSKRRDQDRTLSVSVVKKNDEAEPWVSGILQTPHILPLRLTNLLTLHHLAVINIYSPATGAEVAELAPGSDALN